MPREMRSLSVSTSSHNGFTIFGPFLKLVLRSYAASAGTFAYAQIGQVKPWPSTSPIPKEPNREQTRNSVLNSSHSAFDNGSNWELVSNDVQGIGSIACFRPTAKSRLEWISTSRTSTFDFLRCGNDLPRNGRFSWSTGHFSENVDQAFNARLPVQTNAAIRLVILGQRGQ